MTLGLGPALAFDGSTSDPSEKIPKNFTDPGQALRSGLDDLKAGNTDAAAAALTYAADSGQGLAQWKLGEMYADGQGVPQDDLKAYHYFNQLVENYDEDQPDRRNVSLISNAFVAVGVYCLNGIPNSDVRPDPQRAHELFQYAATSFGDLNGQYNLAHMYMVGAGGLAKDNIAAIRWLANAAQKGHAPSQALLGHMLFLGDGVPRQRPRGLMWLQFAKDGAPAQGDPWIRDLYQRDLESASNDDRQAAAALHDARPKQAFPSAPVRDVVKFVLKPFQFGPLAGTPAPQ
jgi:TPR repeat protein